MRIIADSPALYTPEEGREVGITVVPTCTIIDGEVYRDYEDINGEEFLQKIEEGAVPTTSQPAMGDVVDVYESTEEEILFFTIGDGLSGTYQNAQGAKNCVDNPERIHVIDTKTLAGPQRYLIQRALKLKEMGMGIEKIKEEIKKNIDSSMSFVIPEDFEFLRRSGRLTALAAKIGTMVRIFPVMTQTEDMRRITVLTIKRTQKQAVDAIVEQMKESGVDENYLITISHAGVCEKAKKVMNQIKGTFANTKMEIHQLAPSLMTHGGPGCVVVQAIRR